MSEKSTYEELEQRILELEQVVSGRKQAEKALQESEAKYKSLINNLNVGVYRNTVGSKGKFIEANPALVKMFGFDSMEEFFKVSVSDLYKSPYDRKQVAAEILKTGTVRNKELQLQKLDGTLFTASISAVAVKDEEDEVKYFDGIIEDITDRKRAGEELRKSEERLKAIFEANPDPVVVYDINGHPLYLNPVFADIFGWTLNELQGRRIPFVPDDQQEITHLKIKEIYESGNPVRFETKRLSKHDKTINVFLSAAIIKDSQGINTGLVVNLTDITERKKIENQLRQSQKMEAIGTLAGGIAHDFNNILSGIFGYTHLVGMNINDPVKIKKNLNQVVKGAQRAAELVQQILAFSKQVEYKKKPLELYFIVKEAIKFLHSSIPTTIKIQENISSRAMVLADSTQVHQVVINLCTNAYHAMGDSGGILSVELNDVEITHPSEFMANFCKPGNYVKLEVRDTGHGMNKETLERIFDPYFTTKKLDKGTGLGLAVVAGIVKKHNGYIKTYSKVGHGSTFQVFWPVTENKRSHNFSENKKIDLPKGTEQIMLVDDEIDILVTSQAILEKQGYKVAAFKNGLSALQAFSKNPDYFDLVITDMAMPQMAGDEFAVKILKIRKGMPIVLCTGFSETISEEKAASLGIKGFLLKPIVMNDFVNKIREVLDD
ncbi:MAG: PAS domain S-box protein [Desulfobacula sp.]|uniref:PAS domain-containing hybrid sensor histidine kinase/response regulator n=1 Tax=Desulfobacula sp. TaxID=2593537 RepID=UPI0025C69061|nr:PAS domain-containing sensor histidine kinase [Desulfobacula sp.]MCD4720499.1 PAS domain S-box protein [Desulfobacula sp.]